MGGAGEYWRECGGGTENQCVFGGCAKRHNAVFGTAGRGGGAGFEVQMGLNTFSVLFSSI
jgi:hypothetical protein